MNTLALTSSTSYHQHTWLSALDLAIRNLELWLSALAIRIAGIWLSALTERGLTGGLN